MADNARAAVLSRIDAVDALRGFALLGIIVAHMCEQFLASPPPPSMPDFGVHSAADRVAQVIYGVFVVGKFFPIFSLLFGVSFFIQMDRAAARGESFTGRFLWRLALLFAIGLVHHAVYRGDILTVFAVLGIPLMAFYRASGRTLVAVALMLGLGLPRLVITLLATGPPLQLPPDQVLETYFAAVQNGSFLDVARLNLQEGFLTKFDFQFNVFGRGYQTLALFLLGLWLARERWHETVANRLPQLRRAVWVSTGVLAAAFAGMGLMIAVLGVPSSVEQTTRAHVVIGLTLMDLANLALACALAAGFLLLYHRRGPHRLLRRLAPVGQAALTVYVTQTLMGVLILYGYGFGLVGHIGTSVALLIALALFTVQAAAAGWWFRRFRYGPLEWVWRSLTYLRPMPMRRPQASPAASAAVPDSV